MNISVIIYSKLLFLHLSNLLKAIYFLFPIKNKFLIYLLFLIFCGFSSFSQDITIDGGGTVRCPVASLGASSTISGKTYYVADSSAITSILDSG
ncbi:MAG: hypothetical protein P8N57_08300, partial [Flavobacteriaceae bacterium]|nr:hypothetical protein [Flavobacteriaceae bacterium]